MDDNEGNESNRNQNNIKSSKIKSLLDQINSEDNQTSSTPNKFHDTNNMSTDKSIFSSTDIKIPLIELTTTDLSIIRRLNKKNIFFISQLFDTQPILEEIETSEDKKTKIIDEAISIMEHKNHKVHRKYLVYNDTTKEYNTDYELDSDITVINEIGPDMRERLSEKGYNALYELANTSITDFIRDTGYSLQLSLKWIIDAQNKLNGKITLEEEGFGQIYDIAGTAKPHDLLSELKGLNEFDFNKLTEYDFLKLGDIAVLNPLIISQNTGYPISQIGAWIAEAQIQLFDEIHIHAWSNGEISFNNINTELLDLPQITNNDIIDLNLHGIFKLEHLVKNSLKEIQVITGRDIQILTEWMKFAKSVLNEM